MVITIVTSLIALFFVGKLLGNLNPTGSLSCIEVTDQGEPPKAEAHEGKAEGYLVPPPSFWNPDSGVGQPVPQVQC